MTKDEFIEKVQYYTSDEFLSKIVEADVAGSDDNFVLAVAFGCIKNDLRRLEK